MKNKCRKERNAFEMFFTFFSYCKFYSSEKPQTDRVRYTLLLKCEKQPRLTEKKM